MNINWLSIILIFAALQTFLLGHYTWNKKNIPGMRYYSILLFALTEWSLANAIEYMLPDVASKIFMTKLSYIGLLSTAPLMFNFIYYFTGLNERIKYNKLRLLWLVPLIIAILVFTNEYHYFYWASYIPYNGKLGLNVFYVSGVGVWITAIYCYIILLIAFYCALKFFPRHHTKYNWQAKLFIFA